MGIVKSGLKALTKGGAKKAPKAAAKKAPKAPKKPISQAQKDKWLIEGAILTPLIGAEAAILNQQSAQLEANRAKRQAELAAARGKPGSRAIGADKFGWAGRR